VEYKRYKELKYFIHAVELRKFISTLAKKFPSYEKFLLTAQIIDSSRSITKNMAEGYGRYTYADRGNFSVMLRGSVTETMENLTTAFDESFITMDELNEGEQKCELVFKLTNGYISYMDRTNSSKDNSIRTPNSESDSYRIQTPKS